MGNEKEKPGRVNLCIGQSGMGKTTLARKLTAKSNRLVVIDSKSDLDVGQVFVDDLPGAFAAMRSKEFRVVFRYSNSEKAARWLFYKALSHGRVDVWIDEIAYFAKPGHDRMIAGLDQIIRIGRSRKVRLFGCTHRPQDCNDLIFGESVLFLFRLCSPRSLVKMREVWPEAGDVLPSLPDYEWVRHQTGA